MTITAPTTLAGFSGFLTREQSAPIFEKAAEMSIVQRLAQQVPLGPSGRAIPVFTAEPTAGWVAEGQEKPKTQGAMSLKNMDPKKLATIFVVSEEVVRADPGGFMGAMRTKVGAAFATAFDLAALHGTSSPFDADIADTSHTVPLGDAKAIYGNLIEGLADITGEDYDLTAFAMSPRAEAVLLGATDNDGRPIFTNVPVAETATGVRSGTIIGRPAAIGKAVHAAGDVKIIGGDWSQAAWGVVGGINYTVSNQASVTINGQLVSLWENNLVAVRAEAEYGFVLNDPDAFVLYTKADAGSSSSSSDDESSSSSSSS